MAVMTIRNIDDAIKNRLGGGLVEAVFFLDGNLGRFFLVAEQLFAGFLDKTEQSHFQSLPG